jgi:hypothetical protein
VQFQKAVQALCDAGVDFVVIGGLAATLHGSAQVTYDLDICYSRTSANLRWLIEALAPFHPRPRGFPVAFRSFGMKGLCATAVFTLQTDIGEIDLLAEVTGLGAFDDVKQHSITVEAFERQIATLDLPGLIRAKRATGREKDLIALAELESLLEAGEP